MTSVPARPSAGPASSGLTEFDILKAKHKLVARLHLDEPVRLTVRL